MPEYNTIMWEPPEDLKQRSNLRKFEEWLLAQKGLEFGSYSDLHHWSVNKPADFWESIWDYFGVKAHSPYEAVRTGEAMPGIKWFEGAGLNYAEHIFRNRNTNYPALLYKSEYTPLQEISWNELDIKVSKLRSYLKQQGIGKGDRIAAYLPNIPEAIISFLAVNSLGAIWSCCSPDFGVDTVVDRFSQIEPGILIAGNGYRYNGKEISRVGEIQQICKGLESLRQVIMVPFLDNIHQHPESGRVTVTAWHEVQSVSPEPLAFTPVEFNDPIWVLYSSGTTGRPKAITHSNGGVLLEHFKYLSLQNDVKRGENFFWFTTTGWMMWNFLQASMLVGGVPVLYEGSPSHPDLNVLWQLAEEAPVHHFGTSAPYLVACMKKKMGPGNRFDLSVLRTIGSTGAPLPPEAFEWVYESVKKDLWLCSMSGGTDVCTAFVGSTPYKPVRKGIIQCRALGCDLRAFDEEGVELTGELGEMVITEAMPSMPVYFWGDEDNERYKSSYFEKYPGVWRHGDWICIYEHGGLVIQGRSDATLNRKGVRIGTAEIYAVLNRMPGIKDSLIVNLEREDNEDLMPLFVVLNNSRSLEEITPDILNNLKEQCSPRHVPDKVIAVPDIPYTLSGKKMEVPVKKLLLGMDIKKSMNKDAARNPEAINYFRKLKETL